MSSGHPIDSPSVSIVLRLHGDRDAGHIEARFNLAQLRSSCDYLRGLLDFEIHTWPEEDAVEECLDGDAQRPRVYAVHTGPCRADLAAKVLSHLAQGTPLDGLEVDGSNAAELLGLADAWCLPAVRAHVVACLRKSMCGAFRRPVAGSVAVEAVPGVAVLLRTASEYGISDPEGGLRRLYDECVAWMAAWPVRVWPNRAFAALKREIQDEVLAAAKAGVRPASAPACLAACRHLSAITPMVAWAGAVQAMRDELAGHALGFAWGHFAEVCSSAGGRQDPTDCWSALLEELLDYVAANPDMDVAVRLLPVWQATRGSLLAPPRGALQPPAFAPLAAVPASSSARQQRGGAGGSGARRGGGGGEVGGGGAAGEEAESWLSGEEAALMQALHDHLCSYIVRHMPAVARSPAFRALPPAQQRQLTRLAEQGLAAGPGPPGDKPAAEATGRRLGAEQASVSFLAASGPGARLRSPRSPPADVPARGSTSGARSAPFSHHSLAGAAGEGAGGAAAGGAAWVIPAGPATPTVQGRRAPEAGPRTAEREGTGPRPAAPVRSMTTGSRSGRRGAPGAEGEVGPLGGGAATPLARRAASARQAGGGVEALRSARPGSAGGGAAAAASPVTGRAGGGGNAAARAASARTPGRVEAAQPRSAAKRKQAMAQDGDGAAEAPPQRSPEGTAGGAAVEALHGDVGEVSLSPGASGQAAAGLSGGMGNVPGSESDQTVTAGGASGDAECAEEAQDQDAASVTGLRTQSSSGLASCNTSPISRRCAESQATEAEASTPSAGHVASEDGASAGAASPGQCDTETPACVASDAEGAGPPAVVTAADCRYTICNGSVDDEGVDGPGMGLSQPPGTQAEGSDARVSCDGETAQLGSTCGGAPSVEPCGSRQAQDGAPGPDDVQHGASNAEMHAAAPYVPAALTALGHAATMVAAEAAADADAFAAEAAATHAAADAVRIAAEVASFGADGLEGRTPESALDHAAGRGLSAGEDPAAAPGTALPGCDEGLEAEGGSVLAADGSRGPVVGSFSLSAAAEVAAPHRVETIGADAPSGAATLGSGEETSVAEEALGEAPCSPAAICFSVGAVSVPASPTTQGQTGSAIDTESLAQELAAATVPSVSLAPAHGLTPRGETGLGSARQSVDGMEMEGLAGSTVGEAGAAAAREAALGASASGCDVPAPPAAAAAGQGARPAADDGTARGASPGSTGRGAGSVTCPVPPSAGLPSSSGAGRTAAGASGRGTGAEAGCTAAGGPAPAVANPAAARTPNARIRPTPHGGAPPVTTMSRPAAAGLAGPASAAAAGLARPASAAAARASPAAAAGPAARTPPTLRRAAAGAASGPSPPPSASRSAAGSGSRPASAAASAAAPPKAAAAPTPPKGATAARTPVHGKPVAPAAAGRAAAAAAAARPRPAGSAASPVGPASSGGASSGKVSATAASAAAAARGGGGGLSSAAAASRAGAAVASAAAAARNRTAGLGSAAAASKAGATAASAAAASARDRTGGPPQQRAPPAKAGPARPVAAAAAPVPAPRPQPRTTLAGAGPAPAPASTSRRPPPESAPKADGAGPSASAPADRTPVPDAGAVRGVRPETDATPACAVPTAASAAGAAPPHPPAGSDALEPDADGTVRVTAASSVAALPGRYPASASAAPKVTLGSSHSSPRPAVQRPVVPSPATPSPVGASKPADRTPVRGAAAAAARGSPLHAPAALGRRPGQALTPQPAAQGAGPAPGRSAAKGAAARPASTVAASR